MSDVDDHLGGVDSAEEEQSKWSRIDHPLRGIALVVLATAVLGSSDSMGKYLLDSMSAIEIIWVRYVTSLVIMMCVLVPTGIRAGLRTDHLGHQFARGFLLAISVMGFFLALRFVPLADVSAIAFSSPLVVTILAGVVLGETVGYRRWAATIAGLLGAVMVARPGTAHFHPALLLPTIGAIAWGVGLIITRKVSGRDSSVTTMTYTAIAGTLLSSLLLPFYWTAPSLASLAFGVGTGIVNTFGHYILLSAYRYADASVLAPYNYTQLIFATIIGVVVFHELPPLFTLLGIAVIIISGIYAARLAGRPQATIAGGRTDV